MSDLERIVSRLGDAVVVLAVMYLGWHVVLACVLHQSPEQWFRSLGL